MATEERRRFSRVRFHSPARLLGPQGEAYGIEVLDLSMRGGLVQLSDGSLPTGALCNAQGTLTLEITLSAIDTILMEVEPAHWKAREIGLRCKRIDLDSMMHLRSLLEANLGDPDLVHRELFQLIEEEDGAE